MLYPPGIFCQISPGDILGRMSATIAPTATRSDGSSATKSRVLNRLRRLEGQVRGLHKMVEEDRPCREILTLLAGVRSALEATGDVVLETYLTECQAEMASGKGGDARAVIDAVRLLRR